jgi:hypothetical protein
MELTDERLKKALAAGNIPITEKALATLSEWVTKEGPETFLRAKGRIIVREIRASKLYNAHTNALSELCDALRNTVDILTRDNGRQATHLLLAEPRIPNVGGAGQRLIEQQRDLLNRAEVILKRRQAIKNRRGAPKSTETAFLVAVRDLFGKLTGKPKPATAERLHRFAKACAELIGKDDVVPESLDTFKKRFRTPKTDRSKRSRAQTRGSPRNI